MHRYLINRDGSAKTEAFLGLIEDLLSLGNYKESLQNIDTAKSALKDSSSNRNLILVHAFEIADWVCLDNPGKAREILNILIGLLKQQPGNFDLDWEFTGTKHFIENNKKLERHRQWLLSFFTALEKGNRDVIIASLEALKK